MKTKLLLTALTTTIAAALYAADSPSVGSKAPDFAATDSKGKQHSLTDYKGKYVVLEWFNPECPFVKKHYGGGNMQKLQENFAGKGVAWLTVDSNAPGKEGSLNSEQANKTIANWKMQPAALLLDTDGKVGKAYGAKNTPQMFVIDPEGKVIYSGAIDSKPTPNPDDIPSSTNYVKVALEEAMAGKQVSTATTKPYGCSVKYD